jgi:hypothetical protein
MLVIEEMETIENEEYKNSYNYLSTFRQIKKD